MTRCKASWNRCWRATVVVYGVPRETRRKPYGNHRETIREIIAVPRVAAGSAEY